MWFSTIGRITLGILLLIATACTDRDRSNPLDPRNPQTGGRPTGLDVISIQDTIILSWDLLPLDDFTGYRVYRKRDSETDFIPLALVPKLSNTFKDLGVDFGIKYAYQISALGESFESRRSEVVEISAGPTFHWVSDNARRQLLKLTHDSEHIIFVTGPFSTIIDIESNPLTGEAWIIEIIGGFQGNLKKMNHNGTVNEGFPVFMEPVDAALDITGNTIWVSDKQQGTLSKLDSNANLLFSNTDFPDPTFLALDQRTGDCWVVYSKNERIARITSSGVQVFSSTEQFNSIQSVEINSSDSSLWVCEVDRVVKLNGNGEFQLEIKAPLTFPKNLAINENSGDVWVVNSNPTILARFSSSGNLIIDVKDFVQLNDIAVNFFDNSVLATDAFSSTLFRISDDGEIISTFGDAVFPEFVAVQNSP